MQNLGFCRIWELAGIWELAEFGNWQNFGFCGIRELEGFGISRDSEIGGIWDFTGFGNWQDSGIGRIWDFTGFENWWNSGIGRIRDFAESGDFAGFENSSWERLPNSRFWALPGAGRPPRAVSSPPCPARSRCRPLRRLRTLQRPRRAPGRSRRHRSRPVSAAGIGSDWGDWDGIQP